MTSEMGANVGDFARRLVGVCLADGWVVKELLARKPGSSGGFFSVGYEVVGATGRRAFLKALDIEKAFRSADLIGTLAAMTAAHQDECALLEHCETRGFDRVVWSLGSGTVQVDDTNPFSRVPYIIFELAESDVRTHERFAVRFETAWASRTLHHVAVGLQQLHGSEIAHQDLKPSNVIVFPDQGAKVGDLGCASRPTKPGHRDGAQIAGDETYAPPEHLYGYLSSDWRARRLGSDLYHLGSLATFMFSKVGMTELLLSQLDRPFWPGTWKGSFKDVLPQLRSAFGNALVMLEGDLPADVRLDMMPLVKYLCDPDPDRRGHPRDRAMKNGDPFSLQRFVTALDLVARRAVKGMSCSTLSFVA